MATVTLYVGRDETERKRRRGKWLLALLVGVAAAMMYRWAGSTAESRPPAIGIKIVTPVAAPPPAPAAVVEIAPPPPAPARAVITPAQMDFGEGPLPRATAPQLATIRNDGGQPLERVTASAGGPFLATNGCANGLAPGAECVVAVTFAPQQPGRFAGALTIAADGSRTVIPLRGSVPRPREVAQPRPVQPPVETAVVQPPPPAPAPAPRPPRRQLCFEPEALRFTSTGKQTITLTNPESTPLRVLSVVPVGVRGQTASGYEVDARRCIRVLRPGQQCQFTIAASELALQNRERMDLQVNYEDPATGLRDVARRRADCGSSR